MELCGWLVVNGFLLGSVFTHDRFRSFDYIQSSYRLQCAGDKLDFGLRLCILHSCGEFFVFKFENIDKVFY